MVTVPGRSATVQAARGFYRDHLGIIVVAQVMGLIAAAAFVLFAVGLQRQDRGRPLLRYAGVAVAAASVVTAVPVLAVHARVNGHARDADRAARGLRHR
jgi:hypothetical protein